MRYFNGGTSGNGIVGSSSDSGLEEADQNSDSVSGNGTDNEDGSDKVSITSGSRFKCSTTSGDSSTKSTNQPQQQQQHLPPPPSTTSWSPPPPISFRSEQQQQHRVTHGPGGKHQ